MLGYLSISAFRIAKRKLSITSDLSLGRQIIKLKTDPFFSYTTFFTYIWKLIFLSNLGVLSICKKNNHLFAMLSIILFFWKDTRSFLWTNSVNIIT